MKTNPTMSKEDVSLKNSIPKVVYIYGLLVRIFGALGMIAAVGGAIMLTYKSGNLIGGFFSVVLYGILPFVLFRMGEALQSGERDAVYGMCFLAVVSLLISIMLILNQRLPVGLGVLVWTILLYIPPIVSAFRHWNCFSPRKK